jgi:tetratricopeptide (TPR) repeat protein
MMRGLVILLVIVVGGAASVPAAADWKTDELLAAEVVAIGEAKFADGDYLEAIRAFTSADGLMPSAVHAFDIAVCHERLGNAAEAVRWYRTYLRRDPDAVTYRRAQQRIEQLDRAGAPRRVARCDSTHPDLRDPLPGSARLAEVTISSYPPKAAVLCHGKRLGKTPLRVAVNASRPTRLVVARRGYLDAVLRVTGDQDFEKPVLRRLLANGGSVHPDLKDPSEDVL